MTFNYLAYLYTLISSFFSSFFLLLLSDSYLAHFKRAAILCILYILICVTKNNESDYNIFFVNQTFS